MEKFTLNRLLFIGTCHIDPIIDACSQASIGYDHFLSGLKPFDSFESFPDKGYDACVVGLTLRYFLQYSSEEFDELFFLEE